MVTSNPESLEDFQIQRDLEKADAEWEKADKFGLNKIAANQNLDLARRRLDRLSKTQTEGFDLTGLPLEELVDLRKKASKDPDGEVSYKLEDGQKIKLTYRQLLDAWVEKKDKLRK